MFSMSLIFFCIGDFSMDVDKGGSPFRDLKKIPLVLKWFKDWGKKIILCLNFLFRVLSEIIITHCALTPVRYNQHDYNKNSIPLDE